MKLKEYADQIAKLAKDYPNVDVCYSIDDEGNEFRPVYYHAAVGMWVSNEFYPKAEAKQIEGSFINAVCIN